MAFEDTQLPDSPPIRAAWQQLFDTGAASRRETAVAAEALIDAAARYAGIEIAAGRAPDGEVIAAALFSATVRDAEGLERLRADHGDRIADLITETPRKVVDRQDELPEAMTEGERKLALIQTLARAESEAVRRADDGQLAVHRRGLDIQSRLVIPLLSQEPALAQRSDDAVARAQTNFDRLEAGPGAGPGARP